MIKSSYKWILILILILLKSINPQSNIKTWSETTVQDFSDNQLNSLIVKNNNGGEVQLPHPLVKTVTDFTDNSVLRFIAKNSSGDFVRTWVQGGNVFIKKYASDGNEITSSILVNEVSGIAGQDGVSRVDMFDDGTYMVVWADLGYNPLDDQETMYAQLFKDDSVKVGNNFKINEIKNTSGQFPVVFANETDQNFWIFFSVNTSEGYKINVQKRDKIGNKIGITFFLNQPGVTKHELQPAVSGNDQNFFVAWNGSDSNISTYADIYTQMYSNQGVPYNLIVKVNDDKVDHAQFGVDLCLDNNNNLFIVWGDCRDEIEPVTSIQSNIYGQIYNSTKTPIGLNLRLNDLGFNGGNYSPSIEFLTEDFQLSWNYWDEANRRYLLYTNKWKFDPKYSGEMTSSIFYTSPYGCSFQNIYWEKVNNPKCDIKFKIRTAKSISELNSSYWYGPEDTSDYYTDTFKINSIHNGDRYVQYKAFFDSQDGSTSILKSISIEYVSLDTIPPFTPKSFSAHASHSSIMLNWESNKENDLYGYEIYKGLASHKYLDSLKIFVPINNNSFKDSSVISGQNYFYAITAMDSSHNESKISEEITSKAYGIDIYVNENAGSSSDGSIQYPFKTIQEGIDVAFYGDTVKIFPGNYSNSINMKNGVSLIGFDAGQCKINTTINALGNCVIKRLGIMKSLVCNSGSQLVTENIFVGSSGSYSPAISLTYQSSPTITKNFITECGHAIQMNSECNPIIKNNIIVADEVGINVLWDDQPKIINNTIVASEVCAINLLSFQNVIIENNILSGGINISSPSYTTGINYNDVWESLYHNPQLPNTNLFLDPEFINADLNDFHLKSSSPCINAGNPKVEYNDIDGTRNDIGAYGGPDPMKEITSQFLTKSIYVSSLSGYPGDTVSVDIGLDKIIGLAKANFVFNYDNSTLNFLNAELTEATNNSTLKQNIVSVKEIGFVINSPNALQSGSNEILKIKFIVNINAKTDDASPLNLKDVFLWDEFLNEITIRSITNGAFVVNFTNENDNYIYVDSKNSGGEDGSRNNPYNTIMEAMQQAVEDDSILVAAGNYNEAITMKEGVSVIGSGASVTNIILTGENNGITFNNIKNAILSGFTIKPDENRVPFGAMISCESSSPVIKKNKIEGSIYPDPGITLDNNSNATIENNYITNIFIYITASNPIIKNNIIEQNEIGRISLGGGSSAIIYNNLIEGPFGGSAIDIMGSSPVLKNNMIYCNDGGWGIFLMNSQGTKVLNNIVKDKSKTGVGIWIQNSSDNEIINNSIITHGKGIEEQSSQSIIMNNIIIDNNNYGVQLSPLSNYDYNDVWNNYVNYQGMEPGNNDISLDPQFVDTAKGNYHLTENSPCINTGNPDTKYDDIDGSRNDIGAYGGPNSDSNSIFFDGSSLAVDQLTISDTIQISIMGDKIKGASELNFSLSFDPAVLSMVNVNSGGLTKAFSLETTNLSIGSINLSIKGYKGINEDNGELIRLEFACNSAQASSTFLHFDDAFIRDEATYQRKIYTLIDGVIKIITGVSDLDNLVPKTYSLSQNYPNPFNPLTKIRYEIPKEGNISIKVFDILGREITTLLNKHEQPGRYEIEWNAHNFASGIYFYRLQVESFIETKKMILLR
ncbi:MAG: hypothetical protein A2455_08225 [Ignavibacteria bacterium RIFOXYC2_FULL_35_16]|nr:MAG: hypothetical protein A2058_08460 [Ignavibacteria bacterium GWA2_36_19]OGU59894.1 MAG: hypothetical protein A2X60_14375 [Ignavibacteria bacterium GWF2_35_20]OGU89287.1 MAG: hypothetical protein A2492_10445 [Ignavibacteria bacterium RIFOXYC12_FULL_35_11]OGU93429.1 MAG: hypothetical protein A2347_07715 [Ignavibacteria bacterium RIFOXYB12_FULL_35_14]OGV00212.1 MAG: hypothetical protein A2455_08225 [Ignavibacteria bacterium RIFOXYC2_FULL_35_16]OGV28635.1 MAG: hypothetical protein A2523_0034